MKYLWKVTEDARIYSENGRRMTEAARKRMYDGAAKRNNKKFGLGRHERRRATREHMQVQLWNIYERGNGPLYPIREFFQEIANGKLTNLLRSERSSLDVLSLQDYRRYECWVNQTTEWQIRFHLWCPFKMPFSSAELFILFVPSSGGRDRACVYV